jgi:hypothetical protein
MECGESTLHASSSICVRATYLPSRVSQEVAATEDLTEDLVVEFVCREIGNLEF